MPSVKILAIADVTHNVRRYTLERPAGYTFQPGQATDVSLDEDGWRDKKHPFTFTALSDAQNLEFTIKSYFNTGGDGVTERLYGYKQGQSLVVRDVWGTITYKGRGIFIAGGAGSRRSSPSFAISITSGSWRGTPSSSPTAPKPTSFCATNSRVFAASR